MSTVCFTNQSTYFDSIQCKKKLSYYVDLRIVEYIYMRLEIREIASGGDGHQNGRILC